MKKFFRMIILSFVAIIITACSNTQLQTEDTNDEQANTIDIYTTVYPLSYFAERIGGEYVNVSSIYPPGSNEHTFEPTQQDMMALAESDLFFYIGLGLEGFVENAKTTLANEHVKFVSTADNIPEEKLAVSAGHTFEEAIEEHEEHDHEEHEHEEHNHGDIDPHVWLSPILSQDLALSIKNELVEAMPENEAIFTENYELLIADLEAINKDFEDLVSEAQTKTFFVSHSSFGYIAGQYGLIQVPIAGLNSQSEPSQKELIEIVDLAQELNVKYVLFEQNISSNLTSIIQNEIGAESLTLHNLSVLTEQDIAQGETYLTLMENNIETFKKALNP
nr:zinc ABC transporter substrate-binding protein [Lysinibacillus timonensis]